MIYTATLQMSINSISLEMLETKNNDTLNDARKSIYKSIIYLEELVTNIVDCPFSDLETHLASVAFVPVGRKLDIVKKSGLQLIFLLMLLAKIQNGKNLLLRCAAAMLLLQKFYKHEAGL